MLLRDDCFLLATTEPLDGAVVVVPRTLPCLPRTVLTHCSSIGCVGIGSGGNGSGSGSGRGSGSGSGYDPNCFKCYTIS